MDYWPVLPPEMPLTGLQVFFLHDEHRPHAEDMPTLSSALLDRTFNCVYGSEENNDLLEFIGDRVLNFYTAELVDTVKITRAHAATVAKVVSNNDTLGRIAYSLRLHRNGYTNLNAEDEHSIFRWDPMHGTRPPKVLADLFEAFVGTVYVKYGFPELKPWLDRVFKPIIKVATGDYLATCHPVSIFGEPHEYPLDLLNVSMQERLLSRIKLDLKEIRNKCPRGIDCLPSKTRLGFIAHGKLQGEDAENIDLAGSLIDLWICNISLELWPHYHHARTKAAHLFSHITKFVSSTRILALVAYTYSLYDLYEEPTDPHSAQSRVQVNSDPFGWSSDELAYMFKYTAGWMFNKNPEEAHKWGRIVLRHIIKRTHDTLIENPSYMPSFHSHMSYRPRIYI
ncbi:ribonuclease III domain-containing protein [Irpex rosettiformis]|uniref:Ribonuclease III domain-containing protein n=1 Tax=Irpex rosettiformis TaxID=378272 RepID=A0ACB8U1W9_9APHY|nr:ribonuclease III domain-containing protein [Irpex rosettiformis]